ncbi:multiple organellar RNA editing factor 8, chloroplastic/mitochondrial [Impatiens glandulifera]|uniref:multiple organellar RNA editing factor 8, chloroplastic/mitochondrial n=1 Tax=Impatiens glandulifera TaxID=253017 RepID=UPI001FB0BE66|nr:multiple organellar RNA editing factor 8, chloroplastic/mitochondrial [Impatiens glandulifera]
MSSARSFSRSILTMKQGFSSLFSRSTSSFSRITPFTADSTLSTPFLARGRSLAAVAVNFNRVSASALRSFSTRQTSSSLNDPNPNWSNRPPKETILLDGCDFEHWLVVMEKPEGDPTRDEIIDSYIKTLSMVVGSEDDARMKIYSVSTRHYFAFGALVPEELSYKIKELPKVRWVLPDSYLDVRNKDYGGEPFIDGQAVPYDPKYHEEWVRNNARANERNRRNDRPRNFDRSRNFDRRQQNSTGPPPNNMGGGMPPPQNNMGGGMPPPPNNMGGGMRPPPNNMGGGMPPPPNNMGGGMPPPPPNNMSGPPPNIGGGRMQQQFNNNVGGMPQIHHQQPSQPNYNGGMQQQQPNYNGGMQQPPNNYINGGMGGGAATNNPQNFQYRGGEANNNYGGRPQNREFQQQQPNYNYAPNPNEGNQYQHQDLPGRDAPPNPNGGNQYQHQDLPGRDAPPKY